MRAYSPLRAIRAKCLDCVCGQLYEINKCQIEKCPLWIYRTGHRPKKGVEGDFSPVNDEDEDFIEEE